MALLESVILLLVLSVGHRASSTLLAWNFGASAVLSYAVGCDALPLWSIAVVLCRILEWIVSTLHTTVHRCLSSIVFRETAVLASILLWSGCSCRFCFVDGDTLGIRPVLGRIT